GAPAAASDRPAARRRRYLPSTPSRLLIRYCCAIERMLLVSQYRTRPAGKKKTTEKTRGMIHIIRACTGSGGVGLSQVWSRLVPVISSGRMKYGSLAARSVIQPIQGAFLISTVDSSTQ